MIVVAWNNSEHHETGAGYGVRVKVDDRDQYFNREAGTVLVELEGSDIIAKVNIDKDSFWGPTCRELISKEIGQWLRQRGLAPWAKDDPPRLVLEPLEDNRFLLRERKGD